MSVLHRPATASSAPGTPASRAAGSGHHPLSAGAGASLLGICAAAAGAGVGLRHLQKTGITVTTVAGLVALLVGVVLLGYAASVAWRGLHRWWHVVLLPVSILVLLTVYSGAVAIMATVVPPTTLGSASPADHGLPYRDVTFTTSDGVTLSGWLVPSRNGAAVVLKHGSGSTRTATVRHAAVLAHHGYGVLLMDARGHGRSSGEGMDLGWYGELDTTAAVTFLARQAGVTPTRIGVVGLSMGGEEAIGTAAVDDRIRAVVAEGASGRAAADNEEIRPEDYASSLERGLDWFTYGLMDLLTDAAPPSSLSSSVAVSRQTEFLVIAAGTVRREVLAAANLRSAAPDRVDVWTVPAASHTGGLSSAPREWERRVVGFLDSRLQPQLTR